MKPADNMFDKHRSPQAATEVPVRDLHTIRFQLHPDPCCATIMARHASLKADHRKADGRSERRQNAIKPLIKCNYPEVST
jgi:hypothetical protein